jgi:hypothetical protein
MSDKKTVTSDELKDKFQACQSSLQYSHPFDLHLGIVF